MPEKQQQKVLRLFVNQEMFQISVDYPIHEHTFEVPSPKVWFEIIDLVFANGAYLVCCVPFGRVYAVKGCYKIGLCQSELLFQSEPTVQIFSLYQLGVKSSGFLEALFFDCGGRRPYYMLVFQQSDIQIIDNVTIYLLFDVF